MDQMQPSTPVPTPTGPHLIREKPKPGYITRLFNGRLNRQNYLLGSMFFVIVPLICFLIIIFNLLLSPSLLAMPSLETNNLGALSIATPQISFVSLLETPTNELWSALGIMSIILSLPYLFSLQIRRLHDLNLNGWLWIINLVPFISLTVLPIPGTPTFNPTWFLIANTLSIAASFFSLYVSLWPGSNGPNIYGDKPIPRSNFLTDILQVR